MFSKLGVTTDFDLASRKSSYDTFNFEKDDLWTVSNQQNPINKEQTIFRILSFFQLKEPEVQVFGPLADKIANVSLSSAKVDLPWGEEENVSVVVPVKLSWTLNGVDDSVLIPDTNEKCVYSLSKATKNLIQTTLPAGTRLIKLYPLRWTAVWENNLYLESDATRYAATETGRLIVLDQEIQLNSDPNWPIQIVYEATSMAQLEQLLANSVPYQPTDPKPTLGHNSFIENESSLKKAEKRAKELGELAHFLLESFIASHLSEQQLKEHPWARGMSLDRYK